jgi:NADH-ubiquinone oxidoreductase chain 5
MGCLILYLPFSYISIFIGSLSIAAFPFLTGFYSKDLILELIFNRYVIDSLFIYFFGIFAALFTALYSSRLFLFLFIISNNSFKNCILKECFLNMLISIFLLSFLSIFVGFIFNDLLIGCGTSFWGNSFLYLNFDLYLMEVEFLHPIVKNLPILFTVIGFLIGFFFFFQYNSYIFVLNNILFFFFLKMSYFFFFSGFFNFIYNAFFLYLFNFSYKVNTKLIDKGYLEIMGPFGLYKYFRFLSYYSLEFSPFIIFFSICFFFISICIILLYIYIYMDLFFFLLGNRGLIFILIVLFFFEWYKIKKNIKLNK